MALHRLRQASIDVDVGKIELTAGLQQPLNAAQDSRLVGGEIQNAVADDDVKAAGLQIELLQTLDLSLKETNVGVTKLLGMEGEVLPSHRELLRGHVHTDHLAAGPHQLGEQIDIATTAAPQVEQAAALQQRRANQAAAVVATADLRMDPSEQGLQPIRHRVGIAAGTGLEVSGALEFLAVIGLDDVLHAWAWGV